MTPKRFVLFAPFAAAAAFGAHAADKPLYGPPAAWVVPVAVPAALTRFADRASQVLLFNRQQHLGPDGTDNFTQMVTRIQTAQGLSDSGAVQIEWNPDTETPTIHTVQIRRDGRVIDVLHGGQPFTIVRRENNLEDDVIDGRLTAVVELEGLRVGDIVEQAYTMHYHDPVLRTHAEALVQSALWPHAAHLFLRMTWPADKSVSWRETEGLDAPTLERGPAGNALTIDMHDADPPLAPDHAPRRYRDVGQVQVTDFTSWNDLITLFAPLYGRAAALAPHGAVAQEADRIRAQFPGRKERAEAALALVQDKVRYVFMAIDGGGYRPAAADLTWQRRFGDCKAKTVLLLALLHALDIDAVPAFVSTDHGDGLDARLPAIGWFDHVLVRATIDDKTYWLDGTGRDDRRLDEIEVPAYHFALPLRVRADSIDTEEFEPPALEPLIVPQQALPKVSTTVVVDATRGLFVPATLHAEMIMRGSAATWFKAMAETTSYNGIKAELADTMGGQFDMRGARNLRYRYSTATGLEDVSIDGDVTLDRLPGVAGRGQAIRLHGSQFHHMPDFLREPSDHPDAPFLLSFPNPLALTLTFVLPDQGRGFTMSPAAFDATAGGMVLHRDGHLRGRDATLSVSTRTLAPEIASSEAARATGVFAAAENDIVMVQAPTDYGWTFADYAARNALSLTDAGELTERARQRLDREADDGAIADSDAVLAQRPHQASAYAIRAVAEVRKGRRDLARGDCDAAFALDPHDPVMWYCRGALAHLQGHYAEAVADFTASLAAGPNALSVLEDRAYDYALLGDRGHQLADYDLVLKLRPYLSMVTVARWDALCRSGKAALALQEADAAVAEQPRNAQLHRGRAVVLIALGRKPDALRELDASIAARPTSEAYLMRAAQRDGADSGAALADINAAIAVAHDYRPYLARGRLHFHAGRMDAAIDDLSTVLSMAPNDVSAYYWRSRAYMATHQSARALADLDALINLQPNDPVWLNERCWTKAAAGRNPQAALPDCDAAIKRDPANAPALDSRGFVHLLLNQLDKALADYNDAIRLRPKTAESLFGRAIVEQRMGKGAAAAADLAAARAVNPKIDGVFQEFGIKAARA